jgi:hypothetical protein
LRAVGAIRVNLCLGFKGDVLETILSILNTFALLGAIISYLLLNRSLTAYASEKGKNLATKEDVAEITRLVESAKLALHQQDRFEEKKYELKYNACLNMLKIVDAQLSHLIKTDNNGNPTTVDKQYADAGRIRACHNELILALDNSEIVKVFIGILTGSSTNPIVDLDRLRSLTRAELGFIGAAHSDTNATWIGKSVIKSEV